MCKRNLLSILVLSAALSVSMPAFAALKTVTLNVPGMDCPVCPLAVKQSLKKVPGVAQVNVQYEARQATVTYDDARTTPKALAEATARAGYPSTVKEVK